MNPTVSKIVIVLSAILFLGGCQTINHNYPVVPTPTTLSSSELAAAHHSVAKSSAQSAAPSITSSSSKLASAHSPAATPNTKTSGASTPTQLTRRESPFIVVAFNGTDISVGKRIHLSDGQTLPVSCPKLIRKFPGGPYIVRVSTDQYKDHVFDGETPPDFSGELRVALTVRKVSDLK